MNQRIAEAMTLTDAFHQVPYQLDPRNLTPPSHNHEEGKHPIEPLLIRQLQG
jgi:hypothetical protein